MPLSTSVGLDILYRFVIVVKLIRCTGKRVKGAFMKKDFGKRGLGDAVKRSLRFSATQDTYFVLASLLNNS